MDNNMNYNNYNNQGNYQSGVQYGYYYNPPQQINPQYKYPPSPQQYQMPKKVYELLTKKDKGLIVSMLILSFLFFDFAIFKGFNLGYTIFYFLFFTATTIYLPNKKPSAFAGFSGALSLACSVTFFINTNNLIKLFSFILISFLYALYCIEISDTLNYKKGSFKALLDVVLMYFAYPFINLPSVFGSIKESSKKNKRLVAVLIGVAVSLPMLMIIVPLLIKSDAAFEGLVTAIFKNIRLVIFEIVLAILFTPYLLSMLYGKKHKLNVKSTADKEYTGSVPITIGVTFLSVISLTYVTYLVSQLAYFFSAFEGFLPEGYEKTASAFARRGFYEMFAVCVINVLMISVVSFVTKKTKKNKISTGIKGLSCFISLFSVVLIITALAKMKLNVETFGFTANRLLVTALIIMVLFAILFFIAHIFIPKFNYFQPLVIICSFIFVALAFLNVDAFVADYNVRAYQAEKLDSIDLDNIDTDAGIPYIIELTNAQDKRVASHAAEIIVNKLSFTYYDEINSEYGDGFSENGEYSFAEKSDFRSYNIIKRDSLTRLINFANSMSKEEREAFQEKADAYWDHYAYQLDYEDEEIIEDVSDGSGLSALQNGTVTYTNLDTEGIYYAEIYFEDDSCLNQIKENDAWQALPLTQDISELVYADYGSENNDYNYNDSLLTSNDIYFPEITNGYYYYQEGSLDLQEESEVDISSSTMSFNLAIYDTDSNTLYFVLYDV